MNISFQDVLRRKAELDVAQRDGMITLDYLLNEIRHKYAGCHSSEDLAALADRRLGVVHRLRVYWHARSCSCCEHELSLVRQVAKQEPRFIPRGRFAPYGVAVMLVFGVTTLFFAGYERHQNNILRASIERQDATRDAFQRLNSSKALEGFAATVRNEAVAGLDALEPRLPLVLQRATYSTVMTLGTVYLYAERFDKAVEPLERAKQIKPDNDQPYKSLAALYRLLRAPEKSIINLQALLEQRPQDQETWNYLGWSYFSLGNNVKARDAYERSLRIRPDYADALCNLSLVELREGNERRYRELMRRAQQILTVEISKHPDFATAYFHMAKTYAYQKDWSQCVYFLNLAVTKDPEWAFWVRYESFFGDLIKARPEVRQLVEAFADVYIATKVRQIVASLI